MVATIMSHMSDHRARMALMFLALVGAVLLASCGNDGGMYQGGGDSEPGWR